MILAFAQQTMMQRLYRLYTKITKIIIIQPPNHSNALPTSTSIHSNRPFRNSEMPSHYEQQFDDFFALSEQEKYAECINLGEREEGAEAKDQEDEQAS